MRSETNVSKELSLSSCILRVAFLLSSVSLTHCSNLFSTSTASSRPLNSGHSSQFVLATLPLTQSQFNPGLRPIAEALSVATNGTNGCSPLDQLSFCWCYDSDQGLLVDCKVEAISQMTDVLNSVSQPIKSLSFHSINDSLDSLPDRLFQNLSTLEQISISLPSLAELSLEALLGLESSLRSLSLINSNLRTVPKQALSRLKSITSLDLQSNAIEEIDSYAFYGLPLVTLNLQSNLINTLHEMCFRGLETSLVELNLIDNRLDSFPFAALTRLEVLRLQSNRITQIASKDSSRLPMLKILDLHSNILHQLDGHSFLVCPNLVSLSVANNSLTSLNDSSIFKSLSNLETLDLSYNKLRSIDLNDIITLRTVDLSNNQLEDIGFHNLFKLKEVFASHNRIARLTDQTFVNITSLSALFLQHNSIESIDYNAFHSLPNLITLDLSSNKLKTIDPTLLAHNTQLQSLYLDHNMLNESTQESNTFPQMTLLGLPLLQQIDLSYNDFRSIPSLLFNGTPSLESLQLDSNCLSSLPNTLIGASLSKLKILTLNKNPIVKIREDKTSSYGLESLESLYINDANLSIITSYDFIGFPNLKTLSLRNNRIENVLPSALRPLPMLCELDLSTNRIDTFPEQRLTGLLWLQTLNLSQNNLLELPQFTADLQSLQTLDLSFNRLTRVHSFGHLGQSVAHISLRHNMIGSIANNAFHNMSSLKSLDLRNNLLTQLSAALFDAVEASLQSILLSGNPFYCDCRLLPIYKWLENRWLALSDRKELMCSQPEKLYLKSIVALHPTDFCPVPIISMMEISKLESTQVRIRWQVQNVSLLGGFTLEYYITANQTPPLTQKILGPFDRQLDIIDLKPDNWYTVCIQANGKYVKSDDKKPLNSAISSYNTINAIDHMKSFAEFFSTTRKCSQVRTLSQSERTFISLSNLALILGLVVVVVLTLTLCVICAEYRLRARRRSPLKSQVSEEYITYRHFSLPSSENVYS